MKRVCGDRWLPSAWLCLVALATPAPLPAQERAADSHLPELQQQVFRAALERVRPAIVRIDTIGGAQPLPQSKLITGPKAPGFRQADGPTTGLIWSADGYIITSSFNFIRDPSIIMVTLDDGRRFVARLVARDRPARLALLKIDATDLPVPQRSPPGQRRPGQWALVAGCGHGGDIPAVSVGVLSAVDRMSGLALQTDAKVSPANYGGPLFDIAGRVLGVCVPLGPGDDEIAGVQWYDSGIGFAIDVERITSRVTRLKEGHDLRRGLLGVTLEAAPPVVGLTPADGLRIAAASRGPAAEAGLKQGDTIVSIDETLVPRLLDLRRMLARKVAGDVVTVTYRRGETVATVEITLVDEEALAALPLAESE